MGRLGGIGEFVRASSRRRASRPFLCLRPPFCVIVVGRCGSLGKLMVGGVELELQMGRGALEVPRRSRDLTYHFPIK